MTGPHRIYGSNETTSIIRPQPSESLTIGKLAPVADADATHAGGGCFLRRNSGRRATRVSSRQRRSPISKRQMRCRPGTSPPAFALHNYRSGA